MARYYAVYLPGRKQEDAIITGNVRSMKGLPIGTEIECVITERDGSPVECYPVPVVNGKPQVSRRGKDRPENALMR